MSLSPIGRNRIFGDFMYKPALNIYIKAQHRKRIRRLAGMLRGLLNSYEGYRSIAGLTNLHFSANVPVRLRFSSVANAHAFKKVADDVLGQYIEVRHIIVKN